MSSTPSRLFTPLQLGRIGVLQHRVVLAPLTRNRASEPDLAPTSLTAQYYRQRASPGGLLITEATHVSPESLAYPSTPGIWSTTQIDAWRTVTQAVHERGGYIVCQLWHTGRVAHPDFGQHPSNHSLQYHPGVSASPTQIVNRHGKPGKTITYDGIKDYSIPKELSRDDIIRLRQDYIHAAKNALEAGFDGIEIHAAHGYLIDQFLNDGVNRRTDAYGGSVSNRCRLLVEIIESVLQIWSEGKVGVRLSPHDSPNGGNTYYGCTDSNPDEIYSYAISTMNRYPLAYLLMTEPRWVGRYDGTPETDPGFQMPLMNLRKYRSMYDGILIGAGGFTPSTSYQESRSTGDKNDMSRGYDALAFGRWFISNPDLPERLRLWHEYESRNRTPSTMKGIQPPPKLNRYDRSTFYTQGGEGYIDYPSMEYDQKIGLERNSTNSTEFDGMVSGKYPLMDPAMVGTSLPMDETKSPPKSRL